MIIKLEEKNKNIVFNKRKVYPCSNIPRDYKDIKYIGSTIFDGKTGDFYYRCRVLPNNYKELVILWHIGVYGQNYEGQYFPVNSGLGYLISYINYYREFGDDLKECLTKIVKYIPELK